MAITNVELSGIVVTRVIFHDVPKKVPGGKPSLAEAETDLDTDTQGLLQEKLTKVLGSSRAYAIEFDPKTASKVPDALEAITRKGSHKTTFVSQSQLLANYLYEQHVGNVSQGLLCVIEIRIGSKHGVVVMKLEREGGAQLQPSKTAEGKKTFSISVLRNLVLTEGTRLYKSALFLRVQDDPASFDSIACDSQLTAAHHESMAQFWLRFLGAKCVLEARVATQRFFNAAEDAIKRVVSDPADKVTVFEALHSALKSNAKVFVPAQFIQEHVPPAYRETFREAVKKSAGLGPFTKDISDIRKVLTKRRYETERGAVITVSEAAANLIEVEEKKVIVNDALSTVR